jgi:hypothetical protein
MDHRRLAVGEFVCGYLLSLPAARAAIAMTCANVGG